MQEIMNKKFYHFVIYFLGLMIATGLLNSVIRFQLGPKIFALPSYFNFYLGINLISLATALLVLKYYLHKKYWFTLVVGTFTALANFVSFLISYMMTSSMELMTYYLPSIIIAASIGLIYGISLIFSTTGQRVWLRLTGIFICILQPIWLVTFILWMNSPEIQASGTLEKIIQWTSLASISIPALLIMNFLDELKSAKTQILRSSIQKYTEYAFLIIGSIAFLFSFIFAGLIIMESSSEVYWKKRNYELAIELDQKFEKRKFVGSKGDTLLYRFIKPLEYDPKEKYPLMVCLHHGGVHGNDNIKQLSSQPVPLLSDIFYREKYPTFLFVPQSPKGVGFARYNNSPSIDSLVFEAIKEFEKEFNIDKTRRYVMGTSGGGYGTWNFISTHPEMFAAAIPISGGGDPKFAPNLTDVSIWAFHGARDRPVPVKLSRDMIEAIKKAGGNPRYTEFPNDGHGIWERVRDTPGLLDWLFEQKRKNQNTLNN